MMTTKRWFACVFAVVGLCLFLSIPVYSAEVEPEATSGEKILSKADQVLGSLIVAATKTGEFIKEQAPLVVRELLVYNTVLAILNIVFALILLVASGYWMSFAYRNWQVQIEKYKNTYRDTSGWGFAMVIPVIPASVWSIISLAVYIPMLLKITLAPRVWLLEYAARLVK